MVTGQMEKGIIIIKMFNFVRNLFPKKTFSLNLEANTIAEAFSYPEDKFALLVKTLGDSLDPQARIISFSTYLSSPFFKELDIKLSRPKDTMLVGYAFCLAAMIQLEQETYNQKRIQDVLNSFSINKKINGIKSS